MLPFGSVQAQQQGEIKDWLNLYAYGAAVTITADVGMEKLFAL